jgi:hypothetical protein
MKPLSRDGWLTISALAVILPLGLLASFKLTGIIGGPVEPMTIMQEPVVWVMERPSKILGIGSRIEKTWLDGDLTIVMGVIVGYYGENDTELLYPGEDGLGFKSYVNATAERSSIVSVVCALQPNDSNTVVSYFPWTEEHVDVVVKRSLGTKTKATYAIGRGTGMPYVLEMLNQGVFFDDHTESHRINVTYEITYTVASEYKKLITTFLLDILTDAGNDLNPDSARSLSISNYCGYMESKIDTTDVFIFHAEEGKTLRIKLAPQYPLDLDLYLYDLNATLIASSCLRDPDFTEPIEFTRFTETIEFTPTETGSYLIKVAQYEIEFGMYGMYTLSVEQENEGL